MYDIKFIRENPAALLEGLKRRREKNPESILHNVLELDKNRRETIVLVQRLQELRNSRSREIGLAKQAGDEARVRRLMEEVAGLKDDIVEKGEEVISKLDTELKNRVLEIPNIPLEEVPDGDGADDNVERHHFGEVRKFAFKPQQHFDLGESLGLMDFEIATLLSGSRFVVLKRDLARMERALGQFMLDLHTREHGYTEVMPPLLVRDEVMYGTAQLPKFADDQFKTAVLTEKQIQEIAREYATAVIDGRMDQLESAVKARLESLLESVKSMSKDEFIEKFQVADGKPSLKPLGKVIDELIAKEKADILATVERRVDQRIAKLRGDNRRWLIPTAEVPLTNLVREQILDEDALPLRFTALTPCFRAEAGAAGKDTRGMLRQHQFDKVELVSITTPEASLDEHER
ncbi:MAG TPA: aminoacyl--tRNA ligase-related protein, partial [Xanthobacteraceae bacterium]|nr:aminoacyl--tRNA ligase-related protein [Xanthobacteraceae bacterium]